MDTRKIIASKIREQKKAPFTLNSTKLSIGHFNTIQ